MYTTTQDSFLPQKDVRIFPQLGIICQVLFVLGMGQGGQSYQSKVELNQSNYSSSFSLFTKSPSILWATQNEITLSLPLNSLLFSLWGLGVRGEREKGKEEKWKKKENYFHTCTHSTHNLQKQGKLWLNDINTTQHNKRTTICDVDIIQCDGIIKYDNLITW